eukprot:scaffold121352_cov53-Attheya_sp.AAC.1
MAEKVRLNQRVRQQVETEARVTALYIQFRSLLSQSCYLRLQSREVPGRLLLYVLEVLIDVGSRLAALSLSRESLPGTVRRLSLSL